jgi:hypothetical protein
VRISLPLFLFFVVSCGSSRGALLETRFDGRSWDDTAAWLTDATRAFGEVSTGSCGLVFRLTAPQHCIVTIDAGGRCGEVDATMAHTGSLRDVGVSDVRKKAAAWCVDLAGSFQASRFATKTSSEASVTVCYSDGEIARQAAKAFAHAVDVCAE